MPILFACQKIQKAPAGSRRIMGVGAFFEVLYIPPQALAPEPEAPGAPTKTDEEAPGAPTNSDEVYFKHLRSRHAPTGSYSHICERVEHDGSLYGTLHYSHEGMTIPGPGERPFKGLKPGQCACCYYRMRETLEWTSSGPGYLALMTPGWYQDHEGTWKWWHGDCPHGDPAWSCKNKVEDREDLDQEWEHLEAKPADKEPADEEDLNLKAQPVADKKDLVAADEEDEAQFAKQWALGLEVLA